MGDVSFDVKDGSGGLAASVAGKRVWLVGVVPNGTPGTLEEFASRDDLVAAHVGGPTVELAALLIDLGASVVLSPTATGTAGAIGVATHTGTGTVPTFTGTPIDSYDLVVQILSAATFRYSDDGGTTWSGATAIPGVLPGSVALGSTGASVSFGAGAYVAGDTLSASCTAPVPDATGIGNALDAITSDSRISRVGAIVGSWLGAADTDRATAAEAIVAAADAKLQAAEVGGTFDHVIVDAPLPVDASTSVGLTSYESALSAAFATFASAKGRASMGAGPIGVMSAIDGKVRTRSSAWFALAMTMSGDLSQSIAEVDRDDRPSWVRSIGLDAAKRPTLTSARFMVPRTRKGRTGFYFDTAATFAPPGSDFADLHAGIVMDAVCVVAHAEMARFYQARIPVDRTTGRILETAAANADLEVGTAVAAAAAGHVSSSDVKTNRTDAVLSTGELRFDVGCVPLFYPKRVSATLRYVNPAAVVATA